MERSFVLRTAINGSSALRFSPGPHVLDPLFDFRPHFGDARSTGTSSFLVFLRWLRGIYRARGTLRIVLDNATFHSRPEILAYAEAKDIHFYWTPTKHLGWKQH